MIGLDVKGFVDWFTKVGPFGLLIIFFLGFQQGWWYFGREREEWSVERSALVKDRDEWKFLALSALHQAERVATVVPAILPLTERAGQA